MLPGSAWSSVLLQGSSSQLQCDETHAAHQEVLKEAESTRELAAMNKARIEAEIQEKMTILDKKKHSNVSVETDFEAELAQQTQLREQVLDDAEVDTEAGVLGRGEARSAQGENDCSYRLVNALSGCDCHPRCQGALHSQLQCTASYSV